AKLRVEELNIANTAVTDDGLAMLSKDLYLRKLNIERCKKITPHGIKMLMKEIPDLRLKQGS
ncbi:MAG: hypothetical protein ACRD3W_23700, partial [Terriglobales bacterium]